MTNSVRTSAQNFLRRSKDLVQTFSPFTEFIGERQILASSFFANGIQESDLENTINRLEQIDPTIDLLVSSFQSLSVGGSLAADFYLKYLVLLSGDGFNAATFIDDLGLSGMAPGDFSNRLSSVQNEIRNSITAISNYTTSAEISNESANLGRILNSTKFVIKFPGSGNTAFNIFETNQAPSEFNFNKNIFEPNSLDPDIGPNLVSIEVNDINFLPSNRDTGLTELFINFAPTLEISKAVPYIDIGICSSKDPGSRIGEIVTLASALGATLDPEEDSIKNIFLTGIDARELGDSESDIKTGFELFTSPQTLIGFRDFVEPDDFINPLQVSSPIDKFRPIASFDNLNIDIAPTTGIIPYKTAKMSLTVHDRGRLNELSMFIKPELYSQTHLYVEYGWAHPDNDLNQNPFGYLMNSLRVVEKYTIVNSSFNLDESGQAKIDVQLAMRGSEQFALSNISEGEGVGNVVQQIERTVETINLALRAIRQAQGNAGNAIIQDIFGSQILGSITSTESSVSSVNEQFQRDITRLIANLQNLNTNDGTSESIEQIRDSLITLYGASNDERSDSLVQELRSTITLALAAKEEMIFNGKDPYLNIDSIKTITNPGTSNPVFDSNENISSDQYVSLAKLLMIYVGTPLLELRKFIEVQFLFYPMNNYASNVHNKNIAGFPIKKEKFLEALKQETQITANLPLERFINLLNRKFIANQTSEAYGFSNLYTVNNDGDTVLIRSLRDEQTRVFGLKQQLLSRIYGEGAEARFQLPALSFMLETVPVKLNDSDSTNSENRSAYQSILRIHIYDSQCTPHQSALDIYRACQSNRFNSFRTRIEDGNFGNQAEILREAVDLDILEEIPGPNNLPSTFRVKGGLGAIKSFMRKVVPNIRYGIGASGITKANFSSMTDSALSTVNMIRATTNSGNAPGSQDAGLPMRITPTEVNLETIGFPFFHIGQQFFVDFDTGTTADNLFAIGSVSHSLERGKFSSSIKLLPITDAYGEYRSLNDEIVNAVNTISPPSQT